MAEAFKKIDTDGNGSISYEELKTFVNTKREIKNETLFKMIFNAIDSDGNGQIDVEEFTKFFKATEGQDLNDQKVGNTVLFKLIDVDNDGKLTSEEITAFFKRIHFETYTEKVIKADTDNDGTVDLQEFLESHSNPLIHYFIKFVNNPP